MSRSPRVRLPTALDPAVRPVVVHPTPPPLPGPVSETVLPEVPDPLTDGGEDRLVTVTPAAAVVLPSAVLLAARQLLEEVDPHARRVRGDRNRRTQRRRELRGLVVERRARRDGDG